ncbi:unnamed protein product [[Candida] boidinii]|nr:hypothetical protein B5S33_g2464 [[Candida] boidinii]GME98433.1 unnamed protein product [[Candida] boidinii]
MMSITNLRSASMRSVRSINVSRCMATSVKSTDSSSNDMANLLEKLQNISKSSSSTVTAADGVAPAASKIKRQFSGNKNKKKFNNNNSNSNGNSNRGSGSGTGSGDKKSLSQKRPQNARRRNFKRNGRNGRDNNDQFDSNFNDENTIDNFQNDLEFEKNYIKFLTNEKIENYPNFKKFIEDSSNSINNNNIKTTGAINSSGSFFQRIDEVDHKAIKESLISRYFDKKRESIFGKEPEQLAELNEVIVDSEGKELTFERINEINSFFFNDKLYEPTSKSLIDNYNYKIKDTQVLGSLIINSSKSGINLNSRIIRLIENYLAQNGGLNLNDLFKSSDKLNGLKIIPPTNKVYPYTNTTVSSSLIRSLVSIKALKRHENVSELVNSIIKGKRREIRLSADDQLNLVKSVVSNSLNANAQLKVDNLHLKIGQIANGFKKIGELPNAINPPKSLK